MIHTLIKLSVAISLLCAANAAPAIDVAVRAAFPAPALLVELLETAAEENATAYYPILDRIAEGVFDKAKTDAELYTQFRAFLQSDGHLSRDEYLSSFDLALSLHTAAPRIEAHYQYYNTTIRPNLGPEEHETCEDWVHAPFIGARLCSPTLDESQATKVESLGHTAGVLPFDRLLGSTESKSASILYADIESPSFRQFHKTLAASARVGPSSYRLRYKPSSDRHFNVPLAVSGYGVQLALKRTDYIVIDDREAEEQADKKPSTASLENNEEVSDLRPLSASEVRGLGHKAATFVLASQDPLDTLLKLTQDFPKHSSSIAGSNISIEFSMEHTANREVILPAGYNIVWINGVQIMPRDLDIYALLEHLRRERKFIESVRQLGLTGPQAVELLTHEAVTTAQVDQDVPRYDWRDETEGSQVIIWLNDLAKDKRYADWMGNVRALLQRTYPGQLPPVARDVHNLVLSVNFADFGEVSEVVETLQNFVKRKVPIRIGLVPVVNTLASIAQAKIVYNLLDSYGLAAVLRYLELSVLTSGRKHSKPEASAYAGAVSSFSLRRNKVAMTLTEALRAEEWDVRISAAESYADRLFSGKGPTVLINGAVVPKSEGWIQQMSQRVTMDTRGVQQYVYEQSLEEDAYVPQFFLDGASLRRKAYILPEDDKDLKHVSLGELPFDHLPKLPWNADTVDSELVTLTVVADIDTEDGFQLLADAVTFKQEHENVDLLLLHWPNSAVSANDRILSKLEPQTVLPNIAIELALATEKHAANPESAHAAWQIARESMRQDSKEAPKSTKYDSWASYADIAVAAGVSPGQKAVILNGRVVGPLHENITLIQEDLETILNYERKRRLAPTALAINALGLKEKAKEPMAFAKVSNLLALSLISDVPEGYFEAPPTVRTSIYNQWKAEHTSFLVGDPTTAIIQIVAAIDPASETAQMWVPVLKILSELAGVSIQFFLNPKDRLEELPVKRFYRYVAGARPEFAKDGIMAQRSARFSGLPADALLNIGMDIPPAWLVAPKDSVHDLDNIKLSAVKGEADITAVYELEHILIEGHSRDTTLGPPPRGAQLVLGTDSDPHFTDTIIMSNLGYFQFKANPGIFNLALQQGRSEEIFIIDSAGTKGYSPHSGDNGTEIALMSFRGATLYPRLSRKPGMDEADVLEASKSAIDNLADKADKFLANAGIGKSSGKVLSKAASFGSKLFNGKGLASRSASQAEINIFSVASGHLYERMLNIMMVSVMKHTKHSVKFWFIEQFLSPSFKTFLPVLAEEYGFQYEMVTYKWPHWLRAQKEKQREIWGYKILFLDVLFPLDLDKVIFVDADQIVRTDMYELVQHDLEGAPYGFTPMCDSRTEMEGFRFWKQGYWKNYLRGLPYHISALYVVDLKAFRQMAAGDRLRQQYHTLSADPASLSNLDQDLPNHMQMALPIHSLPQDWLWCETWCSDEALKTAKTIDLCNNPQTKEPKLDRARRQVPEWTLYDDEIAAVAKRYKDATASGRPVAGNASDAGPQGEAEEESIQERLQREDAERERPKAHDEL